MADAALLGPDDTVFEFVPDAKNDAAGNVLLRLVVNPQSQSELSLGRSPENPIVVDNPTISGHHADLVFRYVTLPPSKQIPGMAAAVGMARIPVCYIRDFSRNGIFVQGVPVGRGYERALADGDAVYLARNNQCRLLYRLRITYASALRCVVTQDAAFSLPCGGFSEAGFEAALSQAEISATAAARAGAHASSTGSAAAGAGSAASAPGGGSSGGGLPARPAPIVREADVHADYDFDESSNASPDFLGDGGFSMVFKARNRATGELVAIKRVDVTTTEESAAQTNATVDPLEVEVAILRRLNHPHIVRLFEVIRPPPPAPPASTTGASATGAAGGRGGKHGAPAAAAAPRKYMYIVTELVTGGELFYRVADGATPEPRAKGLFRQLCKAVAYLHSQGLIHRDLKPENILLQPYLITTTSRQPSGTASSREAAAVDAAGAGGGGEAGAAAGASASASAAAAAAGGGSRTVSEKKYKVLVTDFGMAAMTDAFRGDTGILAGNTAGNTAGGAGAAAATAGARPAAAGGAGPAAASAAAGAASAGSRAGSAGSSSSSSSLHSSGSSSSSSDGGSGSGSGSGSAGGGEGPRHGAAAHRMMTNVGTKMYLAPEAYLRYEGGNPYSAAEQVERVLARAARAQGMLDWQRRPVDQLLWREDDEGDEDSEGRDARSGGSAAERRRRPTGAGTSVGVPEPHSYRPGPDDYAAMADAHTRGYTSAVDSWALGIVLYMVLSSSMPFWVDGDEFHPSSRPPLLVQMMTGMMTMTGPPWDGVSDACKDLIRRMLHPNPHLRMSPEQALLHPWLARPAPAHGAAAGRGGRRTLAGPAGAAAAGSIADARTFGSGEGRGELSASVSPSSSALAAPSGGPSPTSTGDPSRGGSAPEGAGAMASGDAVAGGAAEAVGHKRKHAPQPAGRASDGSAELAEGGVSAQEAGCGAPEGKRARN